MSQLKEDIYFNDSGLDTDSADETVANGDGRLWRNVYVPPDEDNVIKLMKGNSVLAGAPTSTYTYTYWGGCTNNAEDTFFYFFREPGGHNALLRYDGTISKILWEEDKLFLDANHFVHDCFYLDGWIYYNAGSYGLKKIHIERAYNYTNNILWVAGTYSPNDQVRIAEGMYFKANKETNYQPHPWKTDDWDFVGYCYSSDAAGALFDTSFALTNVPPSSRIALTYGTDATKKTNYLNKRIFQFTYRWKYRNHDFSITAPISDVALPKSTENARGEITDAITANDYLNLDFDRGNFGEIDYVELYFREGNNGNWKFIKRLSNELADDETDYNTKYVNPVKFYNEKEYSIADDLEIMSLSDNVPREANDLNFISENVLIAAAITEGYDNPDADVGLNYNTTTIAGSGSAAAIHDNIDLSTRVIIPHDTYYEVYFKVDVSTFLNTVDGDRVEINITAYQDGHTLSPTTSSLVALAPSSTDQSGRRNGTRTSGAGTRMFGHRNDAITNRDETTNDIIGGESGPPPVIKEGYGHRNEPIHTRQIVTHYEYEGINTSFVYSSASASITDFRNQCTSAIEETASNIKTGFIDPPAGMSLNTGDFYLYIPWTPYPDFNLFATNEHSIVTGVAATPSSLIKSRDFKTGANHILSLVYYDKEMRPFSVLTGDDFNVYIPTLPEINVSGAHNSYNERFSIDWQINHLPPANAKYYQWFYAGNSSITKSWQYVLDGTNPTAIEGPYLKFNITPLQKVKDVFSNSNIEPYSFEKGDRVRVLTKGATTTYAYGDVVASTDVSDEEIMEYNEYKRNTGMEYYISIRKPDSGTYQAGSSSLIEIYRPSKVSDLYYTAIGDVYNITGGYHEGPTQNQTSLLPATGSLINGDSYFIVRAFSDFYNTIQGGGNVFNVESFYYSDFYDSGSYDMGKINVESALGEISKNDIRWSNKFTVGTQIIGLARFGALDYLSLPDRYGEIQKTVQVGDILKTYTPVKPIYISIGRMEIHTAAGASYSSYYDKVLGEFRVGADDYGTSNPESVVKNHNYVYGFDKKKGVFWRDAGNGLVPISGEQGTKYKMKTYFNTKTDVVGLVLTGIDKELRLLYVTFPGETLAFNEMKGKWIFYDMVPEGYLSMGDKLYTFKSGQVYEQNAGTNCTFFGIRHDAVVDFYVNRNFNINKIFDSMEIDSNLAWEVPIIEVQNKKSYSDSVNSKMLSKIPANSFKLREDHYHAPFLRNMYTTSSLSSEADLYEGEFLRGTNLYIKMTTNSTEDIRLFRVSVNSSVSEI